MANLQPQLAQYRKNSRYEVSVARTAHEIEEAQLLRYQVFFQEGSTRATRQTQGERDVDQYDADCDHLLVRDVDRGIVVGCYRIMRPETARRRGAFYSDSEFDLTRLDHIRNITAEVGRACIHADFRSGSVIMLLWSGLARYMMENQYEFVIGCASIPLSDGHENAIAVYQEVTKNSLTPTEYRVFPKKPYPVTATGERPIGNKIVPLVVPRIPALIKGYLRLGAWIGGAPAWDPDFNTADLFVLLPIARMKGTYAKHFFGTGHAA